MSDDLEHASGTRATGTCESLRIACLIDDLGTGGAQRIVTVLARQCQMRTDTELVIISLGLRDDEYAGLLALGVRVHQLPARRVLSIHRTRKLVQVLRALRPDVIHTHLLSAHILGGLCGSLLRVPVVSTLHNIDPHPRFAGTWKRRTESMCLRFLSQRCLAVGPAVASSNAQRLGGQPIEVLANPLSLPGNANAPPDDSPIGHRDRSRDRAHARLQARVESGPETRFFLTVGRLSAEKGWPELLNVFDRLRARHPACHLIAVGDGPLHGSLLRTIGELDLARHVTLCGRQDDVSEFYAACDVFVLNSTIEGLPMALLEAMAAGLPVVATRVGDVEYALDDTAVALVNPGDADAMLEALSGCLEQWDESLRRGQTGSARVVAMFDADHWMQRLLTIYRHTRLPRAVSAATAQAIPKVAPKTVMRAEPAPLHAFQPQRLNTLHLVEMVDGLSSGGAQSLMKLRARYATRMGYRIDVIVLRKTDSAAVLGSDDVTTVHEFPSPHMFDPARIKGICLLLRRLRPDVLHTHLRTSNTVGAVCGRLLGIPVVSTLHSIYPEPARAHARRDWAEKWALRLLSSRITAVGPTVRETHQSRFGQKPVDIIPNPVELPDAGLDPVVRRQCQRRAGVLSLDRPDARVVLSVARLTGLKGLHDALTVIKRVRQVIPELHYVIAGEGEQRASLEAQVRAHDMSVYVTLLGNSDRVCDLMAASDLFLLTSSGEGLPLVLLEAMSMHLPIVATRVGDVPWLLQDGDLGVLVDPGDIESTVRVVQNQLQSPDDATKAAERAYQAVKERFSVHRWLRDMDQTYHRAMGARARMARLPVSQTLEWIDQDAEGLTGPVQNRRRLDV